MAGNGELVDILGVEILLRGTYKGVEFSDERINELVEKYDPEYHEAMLNLGHPDEDRRAEYGAVSRIYYEAPALKADFCRVPRDLAEDMTEHGGYQYRSIEFSIRWEDDPDNEGWSMPVPDYLTGVACLGVHPPAVKGMKRIKPEQIQTHTQPMQVVSFVDKDDWMRLTDERGPVTLKEGNIGKEVPAMAEPGKTVQEETISLSEFNEFKKLMEQRDKERDAKLAELEASNQALTSEKVELSTTVEKLTASAARSEALGRVRESERFMEKLQAEKGGTVAPLMDTPVVPLMAILDFLGDECTVRLSDDKAVNVGEAFREVLSALPAFDGGSEHAPNRDDTEEKGEVKLTDAQKYLAELVSQVTNGKAGEEDFAKNLKGGK